MQALGCCTVSCVASIVIPKELFGAKRYMVKNRSPEHREETLSEEDKLEIMDAFSEKMVPKLKKLNARIGSLNCTFAGPRYKHWLIYFKEAGSDFEISEFEYDRDSRDLDLKVLV